MNKLSRWLVDFALPRWSSSRRLPSGLFWERLRPDGTALEYGAQRLMVQARQTSVFAMAAIRGWYPGAAQIALEGMEGLVRNYTLDCGGTRWAFAMEPDGRVVSDRQDLYSLAFVVFATAWCARVADPTKHEQLARSVLEGIDARLMGLSPGLFLDDDRGGQFRQNSHMHLLEAVLEWLEITGDVYYRRRADDLVNSFFTRFYDSDKDCVCENFGDDWSPNYSGPAWFEPGHHFEWFWLLNRFARLTGSPVPIPAGLLRQAERGVDETTRSIVDELYCNGSVRKASTRCWPMAEAIKAYAATGNLDAIDQVFQGLASRFLVGEPGLWMDHTSRGGAPLNDYVPASSLYHLAFAAFSWENALELGQKILVIKASGDHVGSYPCGIEVIRSH